MQPHQITRLLATARNNVKIYRNLFHSISPQDATSYRDGGDGWTALEVLCHVRDFDQIFYNRARAILAEDTPELTPYDHEQLAAEGDYNNQHMARVLADLLASREAFLLFFEGLDDEDWQRAGTHPEREHPFTLEDALVQVCSHDADHLEQITRILHTKQTEAN